jgi:hypothetical protein
MWWKLPRLRIGFVLLLALIGSGCSRPKSEVSGTVTYQGKPVPIGTVTFLDANNKAVGSSAIANGKYAMIKAPEGPVKILVTTPPPPPGGAASVSAILKKGTLKGKTLPSDLPSEPPPVPIAVPAKYGIVDQTDLTYTVQPGAQEHAIELK